MFLQMFFVYCCCLMFRKERCVSKVNLGRGHYKLSLLLFVDVYNPIEYKVFYGSIDEDVFNEFVRDKLLPHINPYPHKHSVIVIDNCSFHHNIMFRELVEATGAIILYLPAYMPMLNLAEYYFNGIKMQEKHKEIFGDEWQAAVSVAESVENMRDKNWQRC